MTKQELIEKLAELPDDAQVCVNIQTELVRSELYEITNVQLYLVPANMCEIHAELELGDIV